VEQIAAIGMPLAHALGMTMQADLLLEKLSTGQIRQGEDGPPT
jgi:hypothetical protein